MEVYMKETISWLLKIENLARSFYSEVGVGFKEDEKFSQFFRHLSHEEEWHAQVMERASKYLVQHVAPPFSISVDDITKEKIEIPFIKNRELLSAGNFSKESVIDCLAATEFSEWNNIFIYIVESLKEEREFMSVAAKMHRHLIEIEQFMESSPEGLKQLNIIRNLPRVWKEHILIIDDDLPIAQFLSKLFEEGYVETAQNGREGLQKIKEKYFDVIISDINMPVMNGIEFYSQASAFDPEIGKRIMFFSGSPSREHADFLQKNKLKFLMKPAPIREIVNKVSAILQKTEMGD
jgi:CheY-like chemotaxis protein